MSIVTRKKNSDTILTELYVQINLQLTIKGIKKMNLTTINMTVSCVDLKYCYV